jgi:uncharacterized coiled-coil DUF342 family protein
MTSSPPPILQVQVSRVSRRLFLQTLIHYLIVCWTGALALATVGFVIDLLLRPFFPDYAPEPWHRWAAAGAIVGLATFLALALAIWRAPSKPLAALELDEKFGLKERVTTSLLLTPEQRETPAGQALLQDVQQRVAALDVSERFPIRVPRSAALVPVCAGFLALVSFLPPLSSQAAAGPSDLKAKVAERDRREIEQKINEMRKKREAAKQDEDKPKSEKLKELEDKLDKIFSRERDTKEQLRERIKEVTAVEQEMKARQKELAEKSVAVKQQLQQLNQHLQKEAKDGPAKDLQKALASGRFDKAQEEIERLIKKLNNGELSEKDKEQLQKQMDDIRKKLENLAQQKDKEEQLRQLEREGKLDAETLKRELDQLKKDSERLKDLEDLAHMLGQCQEYMKKGDSKGASKSLQDAASKLKSMSGQSSELKELADQLQRLADAKDSMCKGCEGKGDGNRPSDQMGKGGGKLPGGRRQVADPSDFKAFDDQAKLDYDAKGRQLFDGYAPGQNYRKPSRTELIGEIQQASQEAPAAIETQRIPKAYRESAKGYFRNLGGQAEKEKEKKDAKPE